MAAAGVRTERGLVIGLHLNDTAKDASLGSPR
jgi:hypothetical protein